MSVPVSLDFDFRGNNEKDTLDYLASIHRELYYWRSCHKIKLFRVWGLTYQDRYAKDIDLWVHFATKVANVECFQLGIYVDNYERYEIPHFNFYLSHCQLNPIGSVNWSSLVSLSIGDVELTNGQMEVVPTNVASLVNARLHGFESQKSPSYLKELLHSVAHVKNLELGSGCIECLSILELSGWRFPPSSQKVLELSVAFEQLNFSGICSFLESSLDLETLVIKWDHESETELLSNFTNEDEQTRRLETHHFNGSFPHLKTIKFLNFYGSVLPLVKYLLKHAIVLEEFVITAAFLESDVSPDYDIMALEFLSLTRSSPHAKVIFSY
ncbi:F-box/LRR-repeat protein [Capsicum chacoense]